MAKYRYKNITDQELMIPGIGLVAAGSELETAEELHSQNLELVEHKTISKKSYK